MDMLFDIILKREYDNANWRGEAGRCGKRYRALAKIHIAILKLCRPIVPEAPLNTTANRPARARLGRFSRRRITHRAAAGLIDYAEFIMRPSGAPLRVQEPT